MHIFNSNLGNSPSSLSKNKSKRMTRQQFEEWLDDIDLNYDGSISQKELHAALKQLGLRHKTWRSWRAMGAIDRNRNKVIDGNTEKKLLIDYAAKHWGIVVVDN